MNITISWTAFPTKMRKIKAAGRCSQDPWKGSGLLLKFELLICFNLKLNLYSKTDFGYGGHDIYNRQVDLDQGMMLTWQAWVLNRQGHQDLLWIPRRGLLSTVAGNVITDISRR